MTYDDRIHNQPSLLVGGGLLFALATLSAGCSGEHEHDEDHAGEATAHAEDDPHAHEGEAESGSHVELTLEQLQAAGIRVQRAEPGTIQTLLELPATVLSNADTIVHVNPRVPGRVRSIHRHLGDHVEEGDLLCVIESVELGQAVSDYLRDADLVAAAEQTLEQERGLFELRIETTRSVLDGAIEINQAIFDREEELRAQEVSTIRPLLEAQKALELARLTKEREETELAAERDAKLLALEVDLREKRILLRAARNTLTAMGVESGLLEGLDQDSPLVAGVYELHASAAGIVTSRHISAGESVGVDTKLYVIEDLSRVWVIASAFEDQLRSIGVGQEASVRLDAFPEARLPGTVALLDYQLAQSSRTLGVRIELENDALPGWNEEFPVRPGMYGAVSLVTETHEAAVTIPESALVHEDDGDFVFVQLEATEFERVHVETGANDGQVVEILSGLEPGEEVVVEGTFLLKSAARAEELGGGHSH